MIKDGEFGEAPQRRPSARHRRAMSAIARPSSSTVRPFTASRPRRPYSAYTKKGSEDDTPQYDAPTTNREWWRYYVKVIGNAVSEPICLHANPLDCLSNNPFPKVVCVQIA